MCRGFKENTDLKVDEKRNALRHVPYTYMFLLTKGLIFIDKSSEESNHLFSTAKYGNLNLSGGITL